MRLPRPIRSQRALNGTQHPRAASLKQMMFFCRERADERFVGDAQTAAGSQSQPNFQSEPDRQAPSCSCSSPPTCHWIHLTPVSSRSPATSAAVKTGKQWARPEEANNRARPERLCDSSELRSGNEIDAAMQQLHLQIKGAV